MKQFKDPEGLTIRQACKFVYPFIHMKTIYLWIRERVFTPLVLIKSRSGPGGGTKLNFTDLTTIGLLHGIFQSGVLYRHIVNKCGLNAFRTAQVEFWQQTESAGQITIELIRGEPTWGRQLQEFLEHHNYDVTIYMKSTYSVNSRSPEEKNFHIWICGAIDQATAWKLFSTRGKEPYQAVVGHTFLMAKDWETYVEEKLRGRS